jgi:hypothetical protein
MSVAERSAAYRARRKAAAEATAPKPAAVVRYRRPADRRSRPQRWADAVQTLGDLIDDYQAWRDGLPAGLADSDVAQRLDDLIGASRSGRPTRRGRSAQGVRTGLSTLRTLFAQCEQCEQCALCPPDVVDMPRHCV